jgi:hypothetical protein
MKKRPQSRHILNPYTGGHLFPPLQERILLCLAERDPQTINETVKAMKGSYKATWLAFDSLEKKKMIAKVSSKSYRGRKYPCFWLAQDGALAALMLGAHPPTMLDKSLKVYPEDSNLSFLLETIPILGTGFLAVAFGAFLGKGKLEDSDIAFILATQAQTGLSLDQQERFAKILKNYPSQQKRVQESIRKAREKLDQLDRANNL